MVDDIARAHWGRVGSFGVANSVAARDPISLICRPNLQNRRGRYELLAEAWQPRWGPDPLRGRGPMQIRPAATSHEPLSALDRV